MTNDQDIHHRRSIRLKGYDYSQAGAYFVTLVAFRRQALFGRIKDGLVILSPLGEIVRTTWFQSVEIRKEIRLFEDEFVVMPDHLHGIIWITDDESKGARRAPLLHTSPSDTSVPYIPLRRQGRTLGSMVAGFKAAVTSRAKRELDMSLIWQRNYYERIIRNESEWEKIRDYILTNPLHPDGIM